MRTLTLLFALLLPAVSVAQPLDITATLDVGPVVTDESTIYLALLAGVAVVTLAAINLSEGATCTETALGIVGAGLVCAGAAYCFSDNAAPMRVRLASGAEYPTDALAAFASGEITADHRRSLAEAARRAGRSGVVLQRVVAAPGGVGADAAPEARLDLAVLDAETGFWRSLGGGPLLPATTVSVAVDGDLAAATSEALALAGL